METNELDGQGFGVTLTLRQTPATHSDWMALVQRLQRAFREAGLTRWHWVVEWQRRGTPHLHLAVYAPEGWESPISD
ncbi:helitron helicase-like domain-containing protein, partial [Nocardioides daeguensis]